MARMRVRRVPHLLIVCLIGGLLAACAPLTRPAVPSARPAPPASPDAAPDPAVWREEGLASWYGPNFVGRPTANGEIFDTHQLTAAHKTLPFDTRVRVTNLANGRTVVVRVNDRGPFKPGRIIDLSRAGAEAIGLVASGVARVRVELAEGPTSGLRPLRADPRLDGYDVILPGLPPGSLLVLRGAEGAEVIVRTVAMEPLPAPDMNGDDLFTSETLAERLGSAATVVLD